MFNYCTFPQPWKAYSVCTFTCRYISIYSQSVCQSSNPRAQSHTESAQYLIGLAVPLSVPPSIYLSVYLERIVFQGWAGSEFHVCLAATARIISSSSSNIGNKISKQWQQQQQQKAVANCNLIPEKCPIQRRLNEVLQVHVRPTVPWSLGLSVSLSVCQLVASLTTGHSRRLWLQTDGSNLQYDRISLQF